MIFGKKNNFFYNRKDIEATDIVAFTDANDQKGVTFNDRITKTTNNLNSLFNKILEISNMDDINDSWFNQGSKLSISGKRKLLGSDKQITVDLEKNKNKDTKKYYRIGTSYPVLPDNSLEPSVQDLNTNKVLEYFLGDSAGNTGLSVSNLIDSFDESNKYVRSLSYYNSKNGFQIIADKFNDTGQKLKHQTLDRYLVIDNFISNKGVFYQIKKDITNKKYQSLKIKYFP